MTKPIIIDSDAFIGLQLKNDAHYQRASQLFQAIQKQSLPIITTQFVVAEVITVLSHRYGASAVTHFISTIQNSKIPIISTQDELFAEAISRFAAQKTKNHSLTDFYNGVLDQSLQAHAIFSFDQVYPKLFSIPLLQEVV